MKTNCVCAHKKGRDWEKTQETWKEVLLLSKTEIWDFIVARRGVYTCTRLCFLFLRLAGGLLTASTQGVTLDAVKCGRVFESVWRGRWIE